MEELIARVAAAAGIEPDLARKAIAAVLAFLQKEGPPAEVGQLLEKLPGSAELAASAETETGGGGMLGGLMGMVGGGSGLMGLAGKLTGLGLAMDQMQAVGRELFVVGREQVGEDTMGQIAAGIPGLGQFI
jgi:hypothetical protein